jgi:hypothetical protein
MIARILFLGLLITSSAAVPVVHAENFTLSGFVVDQHGDPVTTATVTLDGAELGAVSDSLGRFELTGIPRGTYALHVREGCEAVALITEFSLPRPINVPYPVVAHRLDFTDPSVPEGLTDDDQVHLISDALTSFVKDERRVLADAFLGDGVVRLFSLNASISEFTRGDRTIPLRSVTPGGEGPTRVNDPIPVQIWLGEVKGRAFVHLLRATPALPDELDLFRGDRALFIYERRGDEWASIDQLYCIDAERRVAEIETASE